jgi:hypothetical protein
VGEESRVVGNIKIVNFRQERSLHYMPLFLPDVMFFMIQSMTRRKRNGDSKYPCRTPVFTLINMSNPACHVLADVNNQRDELLGYPVMPFLLHFSVHVVKCFLVVNKVDIEGKLLFL